MINDYEFLKSYLRERGIFTVRTEDEFEDLIAYFMKEKGPLYIRDAVRVARSKLKLSSKIK